QAVEALQPPETLAPLLATLATHADEGVPTLQALQRRFGAVLAEALRADAAAAREGWVEETLGRLTGLVTIRRTGEVAGDDAEAILARAEARLAAGDLAAAVAELEALTGPAAAAVAPWLEAARLRLAADEAAASLQAQALVAVGQG